VESYAAAFEYEALSAQSNKECDLLPKGPQAIGCKSEFLHTT